MAQLEQFRIYVELSQAEDVLKLLQSKGIICKIHEYNVTGFEFSALEKVASVRTEYHLLVDPKDFTRANELLADNAHELTLEVADDHYLFEFSNQELYEILAKPDEWSELDVQLTKKILTDRGETISADFIESLQHQRLIELAQPQEAPSTWVLAGYFLAVLGGFFGLFIGWHLWKDYKRLPNGAKVYSFNEKDREQGKNICILSLMVFLAICAYQIFLR